MARPLRPATVGRVDPLDPAPLARVYGAALAAAGSAATAADVTGHVLAGAVSEPGSDERALVARAVRLAVRSAPHPRFAAMEPDDREAVALVRLAGCSDGEAARVLGIDVAEVRRRLLRGLRAIAAAAVLA
jgi:DNA-directed RNA polymerase specialized sigma24 family protein